MQVFILLFHLEQSNREDRLFLKIWQFGPVSRRRLAKYDAGIASAQSRPRSHLLAILVRKIQKCYRKTLLAVTILLNLSNASS